MCGAFPEKRLNRLTETRFREGPTIVRLNLIRQCFFIESFKIRIVIRGCLCSTMEPDTCFTNPYYRSPDYLTRYPAYLRRVAPPPAKAVNVEDLLCPRKFCVQRRETPKPADDLIEDALQPGGRRQSSARKTVASRVPKNPPEKVSKKRKTRDLLEKGEAENRVYCSERRHDFFFLLKIRVY